ncbi:MAG: hypothetical protein DCC49_06890 [Acidobacteria bacterium]|nr:MAG: hypothetical protein DCC49_06890 [Acidobacteriota bacterium]
MRRTTRITIGDALVWIGFFIFQAAALLPWYSENGAPRPATFAAGGVIGRLALIFLALVAMASLLAGVWLRALKRFGEPRVASRWWLLPVGYAALIMGLAFTRALSMGSGFDEPTVRYAIGIYIALAGVVVVTCGVAIRMLRPKPIPAFNSAWLRWPFVGVSVVVQTLLAFALIMVLFWAVPASLSSPPIDCKPPRCRIAEPVSSP